MNVRVRFFAAAREAAAANETIVDLPAGATAGNLRAEVKARYPQLGALLAHSMLAVNLSFVGDDFVLSENCEAAIIPPVSGG